MANVFFADRQVKNCVPNPPPPSIKNVGGIKINPACCLSSLAYHEIFLLIKLSYTKKKYILDLSKLETLAKNKLKLAQIILFSTGRINIVGKGKKISTFSFSNNVFYPF